MKGIVASSVSAMASTLTAESAQGWLVHIAYKLVVSLFYPSSNHAKLTSHTISPLK